MFVSPDDPCLIVREGGMLTRTLAPVVELVDSHGTSFVRTHPPGTDYDLVRAVAAAGDWSAAVRTGTRFSVDRATLTTAGFTGSFGGTIRALVELEDGAWVAVWTTGSSPKQYVTAVERDGRERWAVDGLPGMYLITPLAHPAIRDALVAYGSSAGAIMHPWDGHIVCTWPEK